jgi:hypothetical protein
MDSILGRGTRFFSTASRPALEPTQHSIQWVPGAVSRGVKQQGLEADHSPPYNTEWYTSAPKYVFIAWFLINHRENFAFT